MVLFLPCDVEMFALPIHVLDNSINIVIHSMYSHVDNFCIIVPKLAKISTIAVLYQESFIKMNQNYHTATYNFVRKFVLA